MAPQNRLQALFDLSRALSSSLDLGEVLGQFTDRAAELTGAVAADLSTWDPERDVLVQLTEYLLHEDRVSIPQDQLYPLDNFPASRAVLEARSRYRSASPGRTTIPTSAPSSRSAG